jgi:GTPase SAR1 family protein
MNKVINIKSNTAKIIRDNASHAVSLMDRKDLFELLNLATDKELIELAEKIEEKKGGKIKNYSVANGVLNKFVADFTQEFGTGATTLLYDYLIDAAKSTFDIKEELEEEDEAEIVIDLVNRLALYEYADIITEMVEQELGEKNQCQS